MNPFFRYKLQQQQQQQPLTTPTTAQLGLMNKDCKFEPKIAVPERVALFLLSATNYILDLTLAIKRPKKFPENDLFVSSSDGNSNSISIDPFHNNIQFETKDVIPCAARNLHRTIMLQLHVQNNFMRC